MLEKIIGVIIILIALAIVDVFVKKQFAIRQLKRNKVSRVFVWIIGIFFILAGLISLLVLITSILIGQKIYQTDIITIILFFISSLIFLVIGIILVFSSDGKLKRKFVHKKRR